MKTQLIITHPGSAHFDEVAAVSLILAVHAGTVFRIERREPAQAELDDPDVWVVDIGDRHEPEKHNFDHHQSLGCPAAFVLVALASFISFLARHFTQYACIGPPPFLLCRVIHTLARCQ